jgi:MYXO-CTERM domain-containing protein
MTDRAAGGTETAMQNITKHTAVWMTVAAATAAAHGGLIGGDAITVSSATGFVPVIWDEPTNGFGVVGDSKHHDGSVTLPFTGWSDFGLQGDQRITITWNFTAVEPDRYLWWTITPRQASNQVLAGMGWDAMQWSSMGAAPLVPAMTGQAELQLGSSGVAQFYRVRFGGLSAGLDAGAQAGVTFVPSPGAVSLMALAGLIGHRRRK